MLHEASNNTCIINKQQLLREIISFSFNDKMLLIPMWSIFKWSWMSSSWDIGKLNTVLSAETLNFGLWSANEWGVEAKSSRLKNKYLKELKVHIF